MDHLIDPRDAIHARCTHCREEIVPGERAYRIEDRHDISYLHEECVPEYVLSRAADWMPGVRVGDITDLLPGPALPLVAD